jgi:hypothetical protein
MPNEQTSVPLFTAGEVLTAANMNISAGTGVPVFTNSTTRDAAFGGAGEKVLAEGQLCYLSDSNIVQYYTGAAWATVGPTASGVVQVKSAFKSDTFTMSSATFADVTGLTISITPTSASNKIYIVASVSGSQLVGTNNGFLRLARSGTGIALGDAAGTRKQSTTTLDSSNVEFGVFSTLSFLDSPATTSATTYSVQISSNGASAVYINRSSSFTNSSSYATTSSTITVFEVTP